MFKTSFQEKNFMKQKYLSNSWSPEKRILHH